VVVSAPSPDAGPAAPQAQVKTLKCPNCGAQLAVRSFENAVTVVCRSCHSILDAKDPNVRVLQQFKAATDEAHPLIPLGARGKLRGTDYMAIGFQRRTIRVDDVDYSWHEYLLFNPYKGYRYLTEYNGHWNDVSPMKSPPTPGQQSVTYLGQHYKHFQTATAKTTFVLGEFPWQVRVGETAVATDYVHPPMVISSETIDEEAERGEGAPAERVRGAGAPGGNKEVTWSIGEYTPGADIWKAFALEGDPPRAWGVYANEPSPYKGKVLRMWGEWLLFTAALVVVALAVAIALPHDVVFHGAYSFDARSRTEASFVTEPFELKGHASGVSVATSARVDNNWIYINYALINADTNDAYDFGREVSYYHGVDSDGSWTEGSQADEVILPAVPAGHYYLRVEPEGNAMGPPVAYTVAVTRGVQNGWLYVVAFLALLVPVILVTLRSGSFEQRRWAESDHAPSSD
jgi:hypothetical protein